MALPSPYRRRRPALLKNLWTYRKLFGAAFLAGLLLWFIVINRTEVTVAFPFGLGQITTMSGLAILMGFFLGAVISGLTIAGLFTLRRRRLAQPAEPETPAARLPEDRPPPDYASKTPDGFSDAPWSRG